MNSLMCSSSCVPFEVVPHVVESDRTVVGQSHEELSGTEEGAILSRQATILCNKNCGTHQSCGVRCLTPKHPQNYQSTFQCALNTNWLGLPCTTVCSHHTEMDQWCPGPTREKISFKMFLQFAVQLLTQGQAISAKNVESG